MGLDKRVLVATRGSRLALVQTDWVIEALSATHPDVDFIKVIVETSGDRHDSAPNLGDGIFVKEVQQAVLAGEADVAVHSLKDLPTDPAPGLIIAAIPLRQDAQDALVGATLSGLGDGARVGTGSPRRTAQLRRLRPDLKVVPVKGNVPTRIAMTTNGDMDAVLLALAGLRRLGEEPDEILSTSDMLPAPGQGALAVECRHDAGELARMLSAIHHEPTRSAVIAERAVLRNLGGGCLLPVACFAESSGDVLQLESAVTSSDGSRQARAWAKGKPQSPLGPARKVSAELRRQGAMEMMD